MRRKKSIFNLLLVVLLISALSLCGCTPKDVGTTAGDTTTAAGGTTAATTAAAVTTAGPEEEERLEISYWGFWCANAVDGNYCESLIEEACNVDIKAVMISQSENEQLNLMLASDEMPDCGWFSKTFQYMFDQNDLARTIPVSMVNEHAPGFAKMMTDYPILSMLVTTKENDDEYYGLPTFQERAAGRQYFTTDMYRKDWLDNLGIEMPGGSATNVYDGVYMSDTGYTLDEHKAILEAFTKEDPDGNGQNDTTGTLGGVGGLMSWTLLGSQNLSEGYSVEENGKAVYYYSTERYKELLRYAAEIYQAGYADSEIFTMDSAQFYEKALNEYGGHWAVSPNFLGSWAQNRPPLNVLHEVEGSEILITPGLIGPEGHMGSRQWAPVPVWNTGRYLYISKNVDDAKLAKILEWNDWANFGDRVVELHFGEEGVDFTYDDNNKPVRADSFVEEGDRGIQAYSLKIQTASLLDLTADPIFEATYDFTVDDGKWVNHLIKPYKYDLFEETDLIDVNEQYGSSLGTLVSEYMVNVITGETDLDATWDEYLSNLNSAGYDKICEELDKAPLYADLIK